MLAAPIADDALARCQLIASSQYQDYSPALAEDGNDETRWVSNGDKPGMGPTPEKPEFLQFDFDAPWTAAGVYLKPYPDCGPKEIEVQCSDDGQTFRPLTRVTLQPGEEKTLAFDETPAKHFRILFLSAHLFHDGTSWNVQVAEIVLLSKDRLTDKKPSTRLLWNRNRAVDVTQFVDGSGRLDWDVPAGTWRVLRIGSTLHGRGTSCVGSGPAGLEIDPMSAEAMDAHFAETGAKLIADAGPLAGKSLQYFHIDSWELGQPTWTPKMREEFHAPARLRSAALVAGGLAADRGQCVGDEPVRAGLSSHGRRFGGGQLLRAAARADREGRPAGHAPGIRRAVLRPLD